MKGFDLHTHTSSSDGALNYRQLIDLAKQSNLDGLAITDHDTVSALEDAETYARFCHLSFIPGIELSAEWQEREVHILGYFLDCKHKPLLTILQELQDFRCRRLDIMLEKLGQAGCHLPREQFGIVEKGHSIGRPHVAAALVAAGLAHDINDAFARWLDKGCPGYVPRRKVTPWEALSMITGAGGLPVLAHPGLSGADNLVEELCASGLVGLEVWHPAHDGTAQQKYLAMAEKYNLLPTGGSDFHYYALACHTTPPEIVEELRQLALLRKERL